MGCRARFPQKFIRKKPFVNSPVCLLRSVASAATRHWRLWTELVQLLTLGKVCLIRTYVFRQYGSRVSVEEIARQNHAQLLWSPASNMLRNLTPKCISAHRYPIWNSYCYRCKSIIPITGNVHATTPRNIYLFRSVSKIQRNSICTESIWRKSQTNTLVSGWVSGSSTKSTSKCTAISPISNSVSLDSKNSGKT